MSYGVFRSYPRRLPRQNFIPSLASVAPNTSLPVKPVINFDAFYDLYDHNLYSKRAKFIPTLLSISPASLVHDAKELPARETVHSIKYYQKSVAFVPSLTPAVSKSLLIPRKVLPVRAAKPSYKYYGTKKISIPSVVPEPSLLFVPPRRIELDIIGKKAIDYDYHYKAKDYYKLIGTVTPPPGIGSLAVKNNSWLFWANNETYNYHAKPWIRPLALPGGAIELPSIAGRSFISSIGVAGSSAIDNTAVAGASSITISVQGRSFINNQSVAGKSTITQDGVAGESEIKDGV